MESQFSVKIKSCDRQNDVYHISIDKDVIRPEGGGQAGERGTLVSNAGTIKISNTMSIDSDTILITDKPIEQGTEVTLHIDMEWRSQMMRNHTAEHLFVGQMKIINPDIELGYIWIDGDAGTVEILGESINNNQILEAERGVQLRIFENHSVNSLLLNPEEVTSKVRAREGVQKKHDKIRVVSVTGVDESACSGIHVSHTSEIGVFKIQDIRVHDTSTRIHFVTSHKAIEFLVSVFNDALRRKEMYPFEMEQLGMVLDKSKRTSDSRDELITLVERLLVENSKCETVNEITFTHHYLPGFESKELRVVLKALPKHKKSATLLFSPGRKSNMIFWTKGLNQAASFYVSKTVEEMGGRGGGSDDSYTGGFNDVEEPQAVYDKLVQEIRNNLV